MKKVIIIISLVLGITTLMKAQHYNTYASSNKWMTASPSKVSIDLQSDSKTKSIQFIDSNTKLAKVVLKVSGSVSWFGPDKIIPVKVIFSYGEVKPDTYGTLTMRNNKRNTLVLKYEDNELIFYYSER